LDLSGLAADRLAMPVQHVEIGRMHPIFMVPPLGDVLLNGSDVGASFGARCQRLHPRGAHGVRQDIDGDRCDCDDQSVGEGFDRRAKVQQ
jgi:hypothetical protein